MLMPSSQRPPETHTVGRFFIAMRETHKWRTMGCLSERVLERTYCCIQACVRWFGRGFKEVGEESDSHSCFLGTVWHFCVWTIFMLLSDALSWLQTGSVFLLTHCGHRVALSGADVKLFRFGRRTPWPDCECLASSQQHQGLPDSTESLPSCHLNQLYGNINQGM